MYRPLMRSEVWLRRWSWLDEVGERSWPYFGAAYFMVAVKRVYGMRLMEPAWKRGAVPAKARMPVANRQCYQIDGKKYEHS